ncbi:MAG: cyclic nucleotide-binding domain-containing protein [Akkermansiaceae bacterium]|nr:cyclic nucleotide-binding domain-containing protein [Akkermansiaceae bacterium]
MSKRPMALPDHIMRPLKRVNRVYFTDPDRILAIPAGEILVRQGEECHRVYLVLRGTFVAYRRTENLEGSGLPAESHVRGHEVFRAEPRSYVCVQAFFSRSFLSSYYIVAIEDAEVAYIDDTTPAVDAEQYGTLEQQFIPVLVHELAARNSRIFTQVSEKEEAVRLLQRAEMAATLGQLSAGIAHELNNAVGVISRRTDFVAANLSEYLAKEDKKNADLFTRGYEDDSFLAANELRGVVRQYERELGLPQDAARVLAHLAPQGNARELLGASFVKHLQRNFRFWELGHDLRDLRMAAKHASGIVRAVKLLGGGSTLHEPGVDVIQSLHDAMSLLTNKLKHVSLQLDLRPVPTITADITELVQIWTNIMNNAYDAMTDAQTPDPLIRVETAHLHADGMQVLPTEYVAVTISNNGPDIPAAIREKIFQPSFTTKKKGLDFGLGLGLSIVRRIVDSYNGTIELHSSQGLTSFTINLPTTQIHGKD